MNETIQNLGEGIDLISITEPKFKTCSLVMMLLVPAEPAQNSARALVQSLLAGSCRKYPDNAAMSVKLDNMYGASLDSSVTVNGGVMQLLMSGSVIADRYALHGEQLFSELTDLMLDCLFDPNVRDNAFVDSEYSIERQELLDTISSEINNKRSYALMQARKTAFCGEPDAYPVYGTKEDVEKLTPASVYETYRELLRRAVIRVYYVGPEPQPELAKRMADAFGQLADRELDTLHYELPSPCKEVPAEVTEPMDVTQSQLVLVFKGKGIDRDTFQLLSALYGGTPFSMLFMNVRERLSLCYYCSSFVVPGRGSMIVSSGVSFANAGRAKEAILEQLAVLQRGDFPEELLQNAQHSIVNSLRSIGDTPFSCINESYGRFYTGDDADVETRAARCLALTKDDIVAAAKTLHLDTVYLMQQEGGQA